jgi:hypothetical protein
MAAEDTNAADLIDQRLDALDRALLGLLPRSERLSLVADVEVRVRSANATDSPSQRPETSAADELPLVEASLAPARRRLRLRRSALALTAGILGIVALVLLFALPVTYLVLASIAEGIGEVAAYLLISANVLVVALGGAAAVVMGIVALVRLNRRQGRSGHGWAVTALCTGPLPALAGGLATLTIVLPMLGELAGDFEISAPVYATSTVVSNAYTSEPVTCVEGACPAPVALPGAPAPLVAAAPTTSPPPGYNSAYAPPATPWADRPSAPAQLPATAAAPPPGVPDQPKPAADQAQAVDPAAVEGTAAPSNVEGSLVPEAVNVDTATPAAASP